jgi:protein TonB
MRTSSVERAENNVIPTEKQQNVASPEDQLTQAFSGMKQDPVLVSLWRNIKETIHPPKLQPLEMSSRPVDDHLAGTLSGLKEEHVLVSLWRNIKETINPPRMQPLDVTARPVAVKDIWGQTAGNESRSALGSVLIHCAVVALLIFLSTNKEVQKAVRDITPLAAPLSEYIPKTAPKKQSMGGGGGGGAREVTPPSKGKLPKVAPKQFVPPQLQRVEQPKLVMEPTIIAQAEALPKVNLPMLGDPLSGLSAPSQGSGSGGFGSGRGGGVGSGSGAGFGPGSGGGTGGGAYRVGGGVSAPSVLFKVEPEYSEEARKAKFQGTVVLAIVVDPTGKARDIRVIRPLGLGLDEKAIEAVMKWRFKPGFKDGAAVPVQATVEVNFRLL